MGLKPDTALTNFIAANANYPSGSFKDVSAPAATDGSEYIASFQNDLQGFLQKIVLEAGITVSGAPDTVLASDYYDALLFILLRQQGLTSIRSFATVALMVAATDLSVSDVAITESYLAGKNKGGALYIVVTAATGTADGGEFINLDTHQAQLVPGAEVLASQYGATGAGDDTTTIQALLDSPFINIRIDTLSTITGAGLTLAGVRKNIVIDATLTYTGAGACITAPALSSDSILNFSSAGQIFGDNVTATQKGIVLDNPDHVQVISSQIALCLDTGIELKDCNDCVIRGGEILGADNTAGINITGTTAINNKLENLNLNDNKVGLLIEGGQRNEINHITANACADAGIVLDAISSGAGNGAKFNTFIDVECDGAVSASFGGIYVNEDSNHNVFIRPVCRSNSGAGIFFQGIAGFQPLGNRLLSPLCSSNAVNAITLDLCLELQIQNATLISNTGRGIETTDSENIRTFGGLIDDNSNDAVKHNSSLNTLEDGVIITNNNGRGVFITDGGTLTPESFRTRNCHFSGNNLLNYEVSGTGLENAHAFDCTGYQTDDEGVVSVSFASGVGEITHNLSVFTAPHTVLVTLDDTGAGNILTLNNNVIDDAKIRLFLRDNAGATVTGTFDVHYKIHGDKN